MECELHAAVAVPLAGLFPSFDAGLNNRVEHDHPVRSRGERLDDGGVEKSPKREHGCEREDSGRDRRERPKLRSGRSARVPGAVSAGGPAIKRPRRPPAGPFAGAGAVLA
jgi:hypothetical protein